MAAILRNPPEADLRLAIRRQMVRRERIALAKIIALLAVGLPALYIALLLLGFMRWTFYPLFGQSIYLPWSEIEITIVVIAVMFYVEKTTRGNYFVNAVLNTGDSAHALSYAMLFFGDWQWSVANRWDPARAASGIIEVALWGPRQILEAHTNIRAMRTFRSANRDRIEELLAMLARRDPGPEIATLARSGESSRDLSVALGYMLFYDWIGISQDHKRIWMSSDSKAAVCGLR
jgi:hypothetical protein